METGPPPSQPLFKSVERIPTPPLSWSRPVIYTSHLWAAPGELRGNSPLFVMTSMCQNKEIVGWFWRINSCLLTKCIYNRSFLFYYLSSEDKMSILKRFLFMFSYISFKTKGGRQFVLLPLQFLAVMILFLEWVTPTSSASFLKGITESHGIRERIPHPNITITPIIASKMYSHSFFQNLPNHLLKEYPNTPLPLLPTGECFSPMWPLLPYGVWAIILFMFDNENPVWMKLRHLDLTATYRAAQDHRKE